VLEADLGGGDRVAPHLDDPAEARVGLRVGRVRVRVGLGLGLGLGLVLGLG